MIGGMLYTTAGSRRDVVAIDAATGETLWMFRYDEGSRGQRAPEAIGLVTTCLATALSASMRRPVGVSGTSS